MKKFVVYCIMLLASMPAGLLAQEGFVVNAADYTPTSSSSSTGQIFYGYSTHAGYAVEGLQHSFLYHGEDTTLEEYTKYPGLVYRGAERNPAHIPHTVNLGQNPGKYLLPTRGIDSLLYVMSYGVRFVNDTAVTAPYSAAYITLDLQQPDVYPAGSVPPVQYENDAPPVFESGTTTPVEWSFRVANRLLRDTQYVTVNYPPCGDTVVATDADGNVYLSVRVGAICWTKTNLRSEHYADSTPVPNPMTYVSSTFPNAEANLNRYGHLYSWYDAVRLDNNNGYAEPVTDSEGHVQGICPNGWHLPSLEEYQTLQGFAAEDLMATEGWIWGEATDATGFSLLPAGIYTGFRFEGMSGDAYLWTSTECSNHYGAWCCSFLYGCERLLEYDYIKKAGMSVRCIKH